MLEEEEEENKALKILITGDWHLTDKTPRCRIDDYVGAQEEKIGFIFNTAIEHKCHVILQPGDLCDKWIARDKFKVKWINYLNFYIRNLGAPNLITVYGQHDARYHTSNIEDTPLGVLRAGVGFTIIEHDQPQMFGAIIDYTDIYGAGWGKPIPKIIHPDHFNILVTHRMIVRDKLWAEQENYEVVGTFLRQNKFDLIVSGDNHTKFSHKYNHKYLFNCGSLMRNRIDQDSHHPAVIIFDTITTDYEEILIPKLPFKNVVDLVEAEKEEQRNEKLEDLRDALKKKTKIKGLNYRQRVSDRVEILKKKKSLNKRTEHYIGRIMADG